MQRPTLPSYASGAGASAPMTPQAVGMMLFVGICMMLVSYSEGLRFGPHLPLRTILSVLLVPSVIFITLARGQRLVWLPIGRWLFAFWGLLILWIVVCTLVKGDSLTGAARMLVGRQFTAFALTLGVICCARGHTGFRWMVIIAAGLIAISAFVAVMQWLDMSWAWRLPTLLNMPMEAGEGEMEGFETSTTLVSGLYGNAFGCSYYLVLGFGLWLPLLLDTRWRFIALPALFTVAIAIVIVQERSAWGAAVVCAFAFCLTTFRYLKGRVLSALLMLAILGAGSYVGFHWIARKTQGDARYSIYRFRSTSLGGRDVAARDAIALARRYPLFGTPYQDRIAGSSMGAAVTPHNLFFNSLLWYGVPGLLITITLISLQTWMAWTLWKIAWKASDYFSVGCALAVVAYIMNSQFHNASILNGHYPAWWATGLLIAGLQNHRESPIAKKR